MSKYFDYENYDEDMMEEAAGFQKINKRNSGNNAVKAERKAKEKAKALGHRQSLEAAAEENCFLQHGKSRKELKATRKAAEERRNRRNHR